MKTDKKTKNKLNQKVNIINEKQQEIIPNEKIKGILNEALSNAEKMRQIWLNK